MSILVTTCITLSTGDSAERSLKVSIIVGDVTLGDIGRSFWPHGYIVMTCTTVQMYDKVLDSYVDVSNADEVIVGPKNKVRFHFVQSMDISVISPPASYAVRGTAEGTVVVIGHSGNPKNSDPSRNDGSAEPKVPEVATVPKTPDAIREVPKLAPELQKLRYVRLPRPAVFYPSANSPVPVANASPAKKSPPLLLNGHFTGSTNDGASEKAPAVAKVNRHQVSESPDFYNSKKEQSTVLQRNSTRISPKKKKRGRVLSATVIAKAGTVGRPPEPVVALGGSLNQNPTIIGADNKIEQPKNRKRRHSNRSASAVGTPTTIVPAKVDKKESLQEFPLQNKPVVPELAPKLLRLPTPENPAKSILDSVMSLMKAAAAPNRVSKKLGRKNDSEKNLSSLDSSVCGTSEKGYLVGNGELESSETQELPILDTVDRAEAVETLEGCLDQNLEINDAENEIEPPEALKRCHDEEREMSYANRNLSLEPGESAEKKLPSHDSSESDVIPLLPKNRNYATLRFDFPLCAIQKFALDENMESAVLLSRLLNCKASPDPELIDILSTIMANWLNAIAPGHFLNFRRAVVQNFLSELFSKQTCDIQVFTNMDCSGTVDKLIVEKDPICEPESDTQWNLERPGTQMSAADHGESISYRDGLINRVRNGQFDSDELFQQYPYLLSKLDMLEKDFQRVCKTSSNTEDFVRKWKSEFSLQITKISRKKEFVLSQDLFPDEIYDQESLIKFVELYNLTKNEYLPITVILDFVVFIEGSDEKVIREIRTERAIAHPVILGDKNGYRLFVGCRSIFQRTKRFLHALSQLIIVTNLLHIPAVKRFQAVLHVLNKMFGLKLLFHSLHGDAVFRALEQD